MRRLSECRKASHDSICDTFDNSRSSSVVTPCMLGVFNGSEYCRGLRKEWCKTWFNGREWFVRVPPREHRVAWCKYIAGGLVSDCTGELRTVWIKINRHRKSHALKSACRYSCAKCQKIKRRWQKGVRKYYWDIIFWNCKSITLKLKSKSFHRETNAGVKSRLVLKKETVF